MKKGGDLANNIYDGAAEYGRFMAIIGLIIGCLIATIMIVGGVVLLFKKNKYTQIISGDITKSQCNNINNSISCSLSAQYIVGDESNQKYTIDNTMNGKTYYNVGDKINIYYDPNNPGLSSTNKPISFVLIGSILIIIALLIICGVSLNYYIVNRYKFAAAATGVGDAF